MEICNCYWRTQKKRKQELQFLTQCLLLVENFFKSVILLKIYIKFYVLGELTFIGMGVDRQPKTHTADFSGLIERVYLPGSCGRWTRLFKLELRESTGLRLQLDRTVWNIRTQISDMATANCSLDEDSFLCSICLLVLTKPVTTPCGHNYCQNCINGYWERTNNNHCPMCNHMFLTRPNLQVNTMLSELSLHFLKSVETTETTFSGTNGTPCDICCSKKNLAVKSCLMCLASFCNQHLNPHLRLTGLRTHTLVEPQRNLDHIMCKTHNKLTELYCKTDNASICVICIRGDHRNHCFVPLEEEYEAAMAKKDDTIRRVRTRIEQVSYKIRQCHHTVDVSQRKAEEEKQATVKIFNDLIGSIYQYQSDVIEAIEEKHRSVKETAEGCVRELLEEIALLDSNEKQLEILSKAKDRHRFLVNFSTLTSFLLTHFPSVCHYSFDQKFVEVRHAVRLQNEMIKKMIDDFQR